MLRTIGFALAFAAAFLLLSWKAAAPLHSETVAELTLSQHGKMLTIDARFDKQHLAVALSQEGECQPQEMLEVCGNQYIHEHIKIKVNGQEVNYLKTLLQLQQNAVVMRFRASLPDVPIKTVVVQSDYMLQYNEHAVVRLTVDLNDKTTYYSLHKDVQKITASFE